MSCLRVCFSVSFEELFNNVLAVQCTELFEYGISLGNASFLLPTFHLFKYLYVLRLVDYGLLEEVCCFCASWLISDTYMKLLVYCCVFILIVS